MTLEVRTIKAEEIGPWVTQMGLGFHFSPADGFAEWYLPRIDLDRTRAAFDGDATVGTLRSFNARVTVPGGGEVSTAALTNVTVAPTHRRRGLLTKMIAGDLADSADRGEAIGALIAAEWPIYGRYGYGAAVFGARYEIDTTLATFRPGVGEGGGAVAMSDKTEVRELGPELFDRFRAAQPGALDRSPDYWDRHLLTVDVPGEQPFKGRHAVYRSPAGVPEGYVIYEPKPDWQGMLPNGRLEVKELVAVTSAAYEGLWQFCCGIDLVTRLEAPDRPVDDVLPWLLTNGRAVKQTMSYDFVWIRVLDVCKALAARSYGASGRLVLEIVDEMGFAAGRYLLEGGPDGATCGRTAQAADLRLPVESLGCVYLGGVSWRLLADAHRVEEEHPGAAALADSMFHSARAPWCNTWF